ncbi:JNK-interacting protein 1 [Prorops nasuta]|uniref:JNK-interacting protein 1 n=1 Tax=Prorops nasuta TaxID=863751 RepID=UPI0034CE34A7
MADSEFEEFRYHFERLPQHLKAPLTNYTLVHDVTIDSPTSSQEDSDEKCCNGMVGDSGEEEEDDDDDDDDDRKPIVIVDSDFSRVGGKSTAAKPDAVCANLRRPHRRLGEVTKNSKSKEKQQTSTSLADELNAATGSSSTWPHLALWKCHSRIRHEDSSPDSERMATDSGHSTAHSPENGPKSVSPVPNHRNMDSVSPGSSPGSAGLPFTQLELLEATHRGLHKFIPRHHDEIDLEIGDPIYVQKEADDLWCEGVNLRTGRQGIFPSAYAVDMDYSDFDPSAPKVKRERYLLGYLGSVETLAHKGTGVVCQAIRRIVGNNSREPPPSQTCILEVSDQGLRMVDRSKASRNSKAPCHDYFYSLKNVSFCAFHPRDHRYLGFITKHPILQRFACHVFIGQESTRPVAEAVGRAFHRFYTKFIETAFPIEEIYIE